MLHWQFEVEKFSTNGCFRLHIYLHTNKTLIHNSIYVFDNWGKNLSHKGYKIFTVGKRFPEGSGQSG